MTGETSALSSVLSVVLIVIAVPSVLRWLYSSSSKIKPIHEGSSLVFPAASTTISTIKWVSVLIGATFLSGAFWIRSTPVGATIVAAVGLAFFVGGFYCRSMPIVLTTNGIEGPSMWSKNTFLPWAEIREIRFNKAKRMTQLVGTNGQSIVHSGFHADPGRFQEEVMRRTNLPLTVIGR